VFHESQESRYKTGARWRGGGEGGGRGKKKARNSQARLILEWDQPNGREVCIGAGEVLLLQTSSL
jgi:hypothetical protein